MLNSLTRSLIYDLELKQIRIFLLINKQYSYKKGNDNDLKTSLMSSEGHKFFNNKLKEE